MPSTSTLGEQPKTRRSEVSSGGIARFTPTRLCCSQVLSIQDLFQTPHVGKEFRYQRFRVGAYAPSLALRCLDFPPRQRRGDHPATLRPPNYSRLRGF